MISTTSSLPSSHVQSDSNQKKNNGDDGTLGSVGFEGSIHGMLLGVGKFAVATYRIHKLLLRNFESLLPFISRLLCEQWSCSIQRRKSEVMKSTAKLLEVVEITNPEQHPLKTRANTAIFLTNPKDHPGTGPLLGQSSLQPEPKSQNKKPTRPHKNCKKNKMIKKQQSKKTKSWGICGSNAGAMGWLRHFHEVTQPLWEEPCGRARIYSSFLSSRSPWDSLVSF